MTPEQSGQGNDATFSGAAELRNLSSETSMPTEQENARKAAIDILNAALPAKPDAVQVVQHEAVMALPHFNPDLASRKTAEDVYNVLANIKEKNGSFSQYSVEDSMATRAFEKLEADVFGGKPVLKRDTHVVDAQRGELIESNGRMLGLVLGVRTEAKDIQPAPNLKLFKDGGGQWYAGATSGEDIEVVPIPDAGLNIGRSMSVEGLEKFAAGLSPDVSRSHVTLTPDKQTGQLRVFDNASTNGTTVVAEYYGRPEKPVA